MAGPQSPFRRRAQQRIRRQLARSRAPKHPGGPETQLKLATDRLMRAWHAHLKHAALIIAPHRRRLRRQDATASETSTLSRTWNYALQLLHTSPFKRLVDAAAKRTADSAAAQTEEALALDDYSPNLAKESNDLSSDVFAQVSGKMRDSIARAENILDEFDPDEDDLDTLASDLDDGLAGIHGGAIALVSVAFGYGFAQLVKSAQQDAGVSQYTWMAQRDSVVRPEHVALDDGAHYFWDDPPLSARDSSSGEDCHPGEDYNCRCVASPVPPDED